MSEHSPSFDQRSFIAELDDVAAMLKTMHEGHAEHDGWTLRSTGVLTCSCGEPLYGPDASALPPEQVVPVVGPEQESTAGTGSGAVVVSAPEEIDIATADAFSRALSDAFATGADEIVIDLRRTTFCDSTALRLLVNGAKQAQSSGCRLVLTDPPRQLLLMADILGVSELLGLS